MRYSLAELGSEMFSLTYDLNDFKSKGTIKCCHHSLLRFFSIFFVAVCGRMVQGLGWGSEISVLWNREEELMSWWFLSYRSSNLILLAVFYNFSVLFYPLLKELVSTLI